VDGDKENKTPHQQTEQLNDVEMPDLDNKDANQVINPNNETVEEPVPAEAPQHEPQVQVETVHNSEETPMEPFAPAEDAQVDVSEDPAPETAEPNDGPDEIPGVRRSTRIRFKTKPQHTPSMQGSKCSCAVTQLEDHGVIHPEAHSLFQEGTESQSEPDIVAATMMQLSLKAGLKRWGSKAKAAVHSEMKQLHFRDTFKLMHWNELSDSQKKSTLESHMFLKEKRDGKIKG